MEEMVSRTPAHAKRRIIMAVDDKSYNVFILQKLASRYFPDCDFIGAASASECLERASVFPPDVFLLDYQLPVVDGIELCRHLKQNTQTAHIPIILITAYKTSPEQKSQGMEAGADDFIGKPIDNIELAARINVMLRIKKTDDELRDLNSRLAEIVEERTWEFSASEERYRLLFENMGNCVAIYRAVDGGDDFEIVDFNKTAERTEKIARGNVIVTRVLSTFPSVREFGLFEVFQRVWKTGSPKYFPVAFYKDERISGWRENYIYRLPTGEIVAIYDDVTEKKQAEEERRKLEEQLFQARKMESLGSLAGGIAHDFNNILSVITGYAEFILENEVHENDEIGEDIEQILIASHRARDIVKQILAFSRKSVVQVGYVKVGDALRESLAFIRASTPSSITIVETITAEHDTVCGDFSQIQQVIINLCSNAVYAMREKGGVLTIGLDEVQLESHSVQSYGNVVPGLYLKLTVSDTGTGIESDILDRIFDPYFTTKPQGEGTGFGLAVVHCIVKNHGGAVTVRSEVGKSSTFEILLPFCDISAREEDEPERALAGGSGRILLVDDEEQISTVFGKMLMHLGYTVVSEKNCMKALDLFRSGPEAFDLVITDGFKRLLIKPVDFATLALAVRGALT